VCDLTIPLFRVAFQMEHLELTDVGSVGIGYIASAVHKIDHLVLDRGHLRSQHAVTLAQACCERENPVKA